MTDKLTKQPQKFRKTKKVLLYGSCSLALLGLVGSAGVLAYVSHTAKDLSTISYDELKSEASSNMYAQDGTLIWSSATNKRVYVEYKDLPEKYKGLLLATEDHNFYEHEGLSIKGTTNAVLSVVKSKFDHSTPRGGSTIEQQLIKLTKFSTSSEDRTADRKVKEMFLASQLYKNYSRDQILEFYVNKINMGEHSYGAQTIAKTYFGKTLKELSISQQAIIAGLGQAPSTYNLYDNPKAVEQRRNTVLKAGLDNGVLTEKEYKQAKDTSVTDGLKPRFWDSKESQDITRKHNAYVNSTLTQIKDMGYDIDTTPLQIKTNLNIKDDDYLRTVFNDKKQYFQDDKQQAGMTVTDPKTGNVIAQLGGRYDNELSGINRATQRGRSTGSSIKPVLDYSTAIEYENWATNKILDGSPYHYAGTNVTAYDFGGVTHGNSTMQVALRNSYNTPAIRTLETMGNDRALTNLKRFGMTAGNNFSLSNALGIDASTEEMASAFGAFSNGGIYNEPRYVDTITFSDNSTKKVELDSHRAVRESTAFEITSMLKGVPSPKGTLTNSSLVDKGIYAGAKTGTVAYDPSLNMGSLASDVWTIAYTKSVSMAIWEGYDIPNENGINETNIFNARQDMYKDLMTYFAQGKDNSDWKQPSTIKKLSGDGLDAQYVPTDAPRSDVTRTVKDKEINSTNDYGKLKDTDSKKMRVIVPPLPTVPKSYVSGAWQADLDKKRAEFYKNHPDTAQEDAEKELGDKYYYE